MKARLIVKFLDPAQNALPGGGANVLMIVENLGNSNDRNTEILGNILHPDRHVTSCLINLIHFNDTAAKRGGFTMQRKAAKACG
jgi:hypothetical protein